MANEIAVEQKKPSVVPVLATAAVGGVGGAVLANRGGKYTDHQQIINEVKDVTDFSQKPESEYWNAVKEKYNKVQELEQKLADASKSVLDENCAEAKELKAAKEALQREIERAESEGVSSAVGGVNNKKSFMSFEKARNKFGKDAIPEYYVNDAGKVTNKKVPLDKVETLYNDLTAESKKAYEDALTHISANKDKKTAISEIEKVYADMEADLATRVAKNPKKADIITSNFYSSKTFLDTTTGEERWSSGYRKCQEFARKQIPDYQKTGLKDADIVEIGRECKFGDKLEPGEIKMTAKVKNAKGYEKSKTFIVNLDEMRELRRTRIAEIKEQRNQLADEIFGNAGRAQEIKLNQANLGVDGWQRVIDKGLADQTGLYSTGGLDIKRILAEAGKNAKGEYDMSAYTKDIKELDKMLKGKIPNDEALIQKYTGKLTGGTMLARTATKEDLESALEIARARKSVATTYLKEEKSLAKELEKCIADNSVVTKYDEKIAEELGKNKKLAKINKKLSAQFPAIFSDEAATTTSGTGRAVNQSYRDAVEKAQKAYDKAAAEKGAVNESAKKTAEEALSKARTELDEAAKKLSEKLGKKGGMNKWLAIGIGVVGGGILGKLLFGRKKDA